MSSNPIDPRLKSLLKDSSTESQLVLALNQIMGELRDLRGEHQRTREQLKTMQQTIQFQSECIQYLESRLDVTTSSTNAPEKQVKAVPSQANPPKPVKATVQKQGTSAPIHDNTRTESGPQTAKSDSRMRSKDIRAELERRVQFVDIPSTMAPVPIQNSEKSLEHAMALKLEAIMFKYLRRMETEAHREFQGEALSFSAALVGTQVFEFLPQRTGSLPDFIAYELGEQFALFPSLNSPYPSRRVQNLGLAELFQFEPAEDKQLITKIQKPAMMTRKGNLWTLIRKGELVFGN